MEKRTVTRREFLELTTAAAAGAALTPADLLAAQAAAPGKLGQALIGKLEGPEIIRDPTKVPKTFQEAPCWPSWSRPASFPRSRSGCPSRATS